MKKFVVTGGSGFIGSNLIKFLLNKNFFVINIDKLSYSANPYNLKEIINAGEISNRTAMLASYALCGFANFASIGIQLGGIGSIAPERRKDLSKLVFKAMLGGALASWLTATIAGILI